MNKEHEPQHHPDAPTLTLSPTLPGLAQAVKVRLNAERDPMRTPAIVYPNGLIAKIFPWIALSARGDDTSEPCFSGVTPFFSAELLSALLESLGLPPLPDSSELIWGSLATAGAEVQLAEALHVDDAGHVSGGGWARARQLAELLFRLPLYEPATLMPAEREGSSGSDVSGIPSGEATLSFAQLWASLSSQRVVPLLDAKELSLECLRARAQARSAALADRFVALHLIAPRGLSPLFTRLLDAVSIAIPVHIYLISPPPHALEGAFGVTDLSALTLNLQQVSAISQLSPARWVPLESGLTENTPSLTPHLRRYQAHLLGEEIGEEHEPAVDEQISIELHRCAHDARQVEALRERLEVLFRQDKSLTERDVLILVSDLSRFLPHLEAEFPISSQAPKGKLAITLIDRGLEEEHPYQVLLQALLSLPQRRVDLNLIFSLFSLSPVQQRFMVSPARIKVLKRSLTEAGLRWGFDGKDRARVSGLSSPLHSWRFAIERLLISELLDPLDPSTLCLELCAPKAALGEADYQALSVFLDFLTKLEALLNRHPGGRAGRGGARWDAWAGWMSEAIDQLTKVNWEEKESQLRAATIRKAISSIQGSIEAAGAEAEALSLDSGTVTAALSEALKSYRSFRGRVGRGITVAPLPIGAAYPA
ncbi:MAG: hypothetical protein VYD19_01615, partial [Myxococcota bacterium]|nr:hypothetical protein [Myxococcota bacterium]